MYDVGSKLLNGIKSMYVNSLAWVRVKGGKSECFRINSGLRWVYHVPWALHCIYGHSDEGDENGDGEERRDDLVLCGELEGDFRVMLGHFVEVCRRRSENQYR